MENVIVFGKGNYFSKKYTEIIKNYKIFAFLDNAVNECVYDNKLQCYIYNPLDWKKLPQYKILCMSIHFIKMWKQLIDLGIPSERVVLGVSFQPFFYEHEKVLNSHGYFEVTRKKLFYISTENERLSFETEEEYESITRRFIKKDHEELNFFESFCLEPVSRAFGRERGKPIDRVYIEQFLQEYCNDIKGSVMEIESNDYIKRFGGNKVEQEIILHVEGWGDPNVLKGNFETGEGLQENMVDCLICTQTLHCIFDLQSAIHNIYKILKPNGVALITVSGIKYLCESNDKNWGDYWCFTERSLHRLFSKVFENEHISIKSYGNVKTAMAFLYGLCTEELSMKDFEYNDKQVPVLVTARVLKCPSI